MSLQLQTRFIKSTFPAATPQWWMFFLIQLALPYVSSSFGDFNNSMTNNQFKMSLTRCIHSVFLINTKGTGNITQPNYCFTTRHRVHRGEGFFLENWEVPILQKFSGLRPCIAPTGLDAFCLSVPPDKQKRIFSVPSVSRTSPVWWDEPACAKPLRRRQVGGENQFGRLLTLCAMPTRDSISQ